MANYYTYTQPIRYYKANDPYYYEVDNIPLRQLEENILYIKELIEGSGGDPGTGGAGGVPLNSLSELDITKIKQLRPYAGGGRNVTVNAGLFNSRINDAYNISKPLTELTFTATPRTATTVIPELQQVWTETQRNNVWTSFIGAATSETSYNVNGLEISYTFYNTPGSMGRSWETTTSTGTGEGTENYPKYGGVNHSSSFRWPGYSNFAALAGQIIGTSAPGIINYTFENLPDINMAFVKMWRGVFRTAVVDFPESTIEIPEWNDDDFYYYDENNQKVVIEADQRIDLLVAYSVPIDSSGTALQDYQSGFGNTGSTPQPKIVTKPVLGLFKGAGVGISQGNVTNPKLVRTNEGLIDPGSPGSARMVANASDNEALSNQGITRQDGTQEKIHGSFPSPDDLLNLAPVLALGSANTDLQLVGQAALPIAYIVVTKGSGNLIIDNDIIDIRPFLRTAELTYNERAGVAAANPPLSFANPAIGAFQLQEVVTALETTGGGFASQSQDGKALYTDYVMGGLAYGVEGTLLTMCDNPVQGANDPFGQQTRNAEYTDPITSVGYTFAEFTSSKAFLDYTADLSKKEAYLQYIYNNRQGDLKRWLSDPNLPITSNPLTYLGLPAGTTGRNIPLFPEWDMPMNGTNYTALMGSQPGVGVPKVTWWMYFEGTRWNSRSLAFVPGGVMSTQTGPATNYLDAIFGFGTGTDEAGSFINQCSKKLQINLPAWVEDYDVLVEYVNCNPLTAATGAPANNATVGMGGGLSINKGPIVAGSAGKSAIVQITSSADNLTWNMINSGGEIVDPHTMPDHQFLSYAVSLPQFVSNNWGTGAQSTPLASTQRLVPKMGAAYYPTIKFTIIGYTSSTVGRNAAYTLLNGNYTLLQNVSAGSASNLLSDIGPLMVNNSGQQAGSIIDIRDS